MGLVGVSAGLGGGVPGLTGLEGCEPWDLLLPGCGMVSCREVDRERERAGSGIELKTSLGNKKKTDTQTWHWVIRKRQTHTDFAF